MIAHENIIQKHTRSMCCIKNCSITHVLKFNFTECLCKHIYRQIDTFNREVTYDVLVGN